MGNCKSCYRVCDPIPDCLTSLAIMTDQVDSDLIIQIIDKFDNIYLAEITSESSGIVILDLSNENIYPVGLINPYAGQFKLIVTKDGEIVLFTINTIDYDCLIFECTVYNPKETTYTIDVYGNTTGGY